MEPADEFDMTDEQFDQYMAEGEPAALVDPPGRSAVIYVSEDSVRSVVVTGNRILENADVGLTRTALTTEVKKVTV